jgi:hypothetical protein
MAPDFFGNERGPADRTEGRLDPANLRETVCTDPLLSLIQKFFATGALGWKQKLEQSFNEETHPHLKSDIEGNLGPFRVGRGRKREGLLPLLDGVGTPLLALRAIGCPIL